QKNVCRFYVAVNNTFFVRRLQRVSDLNSQLQQFIYGQWPTGDVGSDGHTFEQFHGDEMPLLVLAYFINGANMCVVQRSCGARLAQEALQSRLVPDHFVRKELQRYRPA